MTSDLELPPTGRSTVPARDATVRGVLRRRWPIALAVMAITLVLATWVELGSGAEYEVSGTVLLTVSEASQGTISGVVTSSTVVDRLLASELVADLEDREVIVGANRVDADNLQVFAAAADEAEAVDGLDAALEWLTGDVEAAYDLAGTPTEERSRVLSRPLDPAVWRVANGWYATGAAVQLERPGSGAANPYPPDTSTLRLLQIAATGDRSRDALDAELSDGVEYGMSVDRRDAAPVATISLSGPDADDTLRGFDTIASFLMDELDERQRRAGVAPDDRHGLEVVGRPVGAERTDPVPSGVTMLIVLVGSLLAVALAASWDLRERRRARIAETTLLPPPEAVTSGGRRETTHLDRPSGSS